MKRPADASAVQAGPASGLLPFVGCMLVNFLDIASFYLLSPLLTPYGKLVGASNTVIGAGPTVFNAGAILSVMLLPRLASKKGTKVCLLLSVAGSGAGYVIQAAASLFRGIPGSLPSSGVYAMFAGLAVTGLFSSTRPVLYAFISEATKQNPKLLRARMGCFFGSYQGGAAMAVIAGLAAQPGIAIPFWLSAAFSGVTVVFLAIFFKNVMIEDAGIVATASRASKLRETGAGEMLPPSSQEPTKDPLLLMGFLGSVFLYASVTVLVPLLQLLLWLPEFGLNSGSGEEMKSRRESLWRCPSSWSPTELPMPLSCSSTRRSQLGQGIWV
ncbi:unnamed protein product [Symbiodinium sp. CCMP2592]|nr:unnamed protein product [Symbiodinium sp. CCMP2592]